ncbi:MAG: VOC family protein [Tepidisphaeraceae bacterium]
MPRISQLNHVALHVSDLDAAVRFYTDVLGLGPLPRPAFDFPGAWFRIAPAAAGSPAQELHLIGRKPENNHPPRERHFAMLIEDDALQVADELRGKGVNFTGPQRRPDGALQIFLRDPDGHLIELCTRVP